MDRVQKLMCVCVYIYIYTHTYIYVQRETNTMMNQSVKGNKQEKYTKEKAMKEKRKTKSRDEKQVFMNTLFRATVLHRQQHKIYNVE